MLYALIGEEAFLLKRTLERLLKEKIPTTSREFNFDVFEGSETQARKIVEAVNTLPVFAPSRVVLVRGVHELKKGEMDQLEPFLSTVPQTTDLILTAEKADKRLTFWQTVLKVGKVQEFKPLYPRDVPAWILQEAKSQEFTVDLEAAQWLVTAVGTDLFLLHMTLEKIYLSKKDDKKISLKDLEESVVPFSWKSLFDLTDAVGGRDLSKALKLFSRMSSAGESPIALIALLARHFRILQKIQEGNSGGISPYFLKDYQRQAGQFQKGILEEKRERLFQADWALKSSPLKSPILFERLLMELCQ